MLRIEGSMKKQRIVDIANYMVVICRQGSIAKANSMTSPQPNSTLTII